MAAKRMETIVVRADALHGLIARTAAAAGAGERAAGTLAAHLVGAELAGVQTHGIYHVPRYLQEIERGELAPAAEPRVVEREAGRLLVSGELTFGQVAAEHLTRAAIPLARDAGVAVGGLVRANHIGRLGHYAELAAAAGLISIICAGGFAVTGARAAPFGGRERLLDTNPFCMGFPAGSEAPVIIDFATTALSGIKVANAQARGERLPPASIVDAAGRPSTDPNDFFTGGAYLPFGGETGGHKGYALMLAVELLGRLFTGADAHAVPGEGVPLMRHQGATLLLLRADLFRPLQGVLDGNDALLTALRTSEPAAGNDRVLYPGLAEARTRSRRQRHGIPIARDVWDRFAAAAGSLGIDAGDAARGADAAGDADAAGGAEAAPR